MAAYRRGKRMHSYLSLNPASEELLAEFPVARPVDVEQCLERAARALPLWRGRSFAERAALLWALGAAFEREAKKLAPLISEEMGKPLAQAEVELARCVRMSAYAAEQGEALLCPRKLDDVTERQVYVRYDPLGVVLGIIPWNFPGTLAMRAALPALAAGNPVILKPAPNVPRISLALAALFEQAGFPSGVFQLLFVDNEQARRLILDHRVRMVSFTGSVEAGRRVAIAAGEGLKRVSLELGGSDPFIVLADADLESAAATAFRARISNAGQVCCCPKRFIVHRSLAGGFSEALCAKVRQLKVGDPFDPTAHMGPLARADVAEKLRVQLAATLKAGARQAAQSDAPQGRGFFHPAVVLEDVPPESVANREELFGPIFPIFPFEREDEALALANGSSFGLGACVFGKSKPQIERIAGALEAGVVAVNTNVAVDPRIPFGGVKDSGFGRACGREGLQEGTNVKSVIWEGW